MSGEPADFPPYPSGLRLAGRRVLVVGGGHVAQRRVPRLIAAGADVVVVSPVTTPAVEGLAGAGEITWHERGFERRRPRRGVVRHRRHRRPRRSTSAVSAALRGAADLLRARRRRDPGHRLDAGRRAARRRDGRGARQPGAAQVRGGPRRDRRRAARRRRSPRRTTTSARPAWCSSAAGPATPSWSRWPRRRALSEADVVVADRLAPRELLDELSPDVELVDVAKLPRGRSAAQEEINRVIVERALAGKRVVRFKGGDSFVFGRGYEEALACAGGRRAVDRRSRASPAPIAVPARRRHPGHPPRRRPRVHGDLRAPAARPPGLAGRVGRRRPAARHRRAADGGAEPAADRRPAGRAAAAPPTPRWRSCREGTMPGERTVLSHAGRPWPRTMAAASGAPAGDRGRSATWSRWRSPAALAAWLSSIARRRPGRPAAGRLPRPARRAAAQAPRGRARAVPRRGREGRTPRGRGRLPGPVVPDGAALARRPRRRARPHRRALLRHVARRWPSRSPASTCTAARWRPCSGDRCRRSSEVLAGARTVRGARGHRRPHERRRDLPLGAPRSASTRCCSRRAAPTRSTAARSRSRWARCSRVPWTRLDDWYDALPAALRRRVHHRRAHPGRRRRRHRGGRRRPGQGRAGARLRGPRAVAALGADRRPPRGHPDARGHRLAQRRRRHRRRLLRDDEAPRGRWLRRLRQRSAAPRPARWSRQRQ